MIAKAKSIAHGGVSLGYITRQGTAQVVKLNHLPEDASPQAIYGYMKVHQKLREEEFQRRPLKNNMIRMEISPSKEESEGWTLEDWKQLAEDFVQAFDRVRLSGEEGRYRSPCRLPKSQYIVTLHTDSKSGISHLHLDCNRVDMDNCLNSDHRIGLRAKKAAEEVNRLRGWKRTADRSEENKARIKEDCLAVLSGLSSFSWKKYTAALEAKGYKVKLKLDNSGLVRGYAIQSGNSVYKSSVISRDLTPSRIKEAWNHARTQTAPQVSLAERYERMTPKQRVDFALSDEGKNCLSPFGVDVNGVIHHGMISGSAYRAFKEEIQESILTADPKEAQNIFRTGLLLFARQVDAATTFAQNCGGGGSAPDQNWGPDKNEDDILWARRCFRKAREMVTTPVVRRGINR